MNSEKLILNYPVFDGTKVWEKGTVVIEDGVISNETVFGEGVSNSNYFLIPGLIDSHTHISNKKQIQQLVKWGITTTCDVDVTRNLKESSELLNIYTSYIMAFGTVSDGKAYVEEAVAKGADYIKVILEKPAKMAPKTMEPEVLKEIVFYAHENSLKVAAHAVTIPMAQMAVDAGVDILIHAPMREPFPVSLAEKIAKKNIAVVPTLEMMETFAMAEAFGIKKVGAIAPGNRADLVLVEGRPDKMITDSSKMKQIWIKGKPIIAVDD